MERNFAVVVLLVMTLGAFGCAGTPYYHQGPNGIIQGGRTGVFGADTGWVHIPSTVPADQPEKVRLEKTYERSVTSWEGCPDPTPNRRAKNIRREEERIRETQDVLNPAAQPTQAQFGFVGGPSTGNLAVPAAIEAAGIATSGFSLPDGGDSVWAPTVVSESGAIAGAEANANADARAQGTRAHGSSHQRGNSCAGGGCR